MTIRADVDNFKFFDCLELNDGATTNAFGDVDLNGSVTMKTVDTQGYDTLTFGWKHGSTMSVGSIADQIHLRMQHASNSTTGINTLGSWSDCTEGDVYGLDFYRLLSDMTYDSWLLLDDLTRDSYRYTIPALGFNARGLSGCFTLIGIAVASQASCKTGSYMPTVAYTGKQRWVRLVMSLSVGSATGAGSHLIDFFAVLGRPHQWPATFAEQP